jgi:hypothetical protein
LAASIVWAKGSIIGLGQVLGRVTMHFFVRLNDSAQRVNESGQSGTTTTCGRQHRIGINFAAESLS